MVILNSNFAESATEELASRASKPDRSEPRLQNCDELTPVALHPGYRIAKRVTDLIITLVVCIVLTPLFLILMLCVKLYDRGPIFYRSTRVGLCGKPIAFWKFRTMIMDADKQLDKLKELNEKDGPIFKMKCDPRVTPMGRVLRRFSLDELPQFFSVLNGDMSLVGPRPPLPHEVLQYSAEDLERLRVKPGITCYWQVSGRSNLSFQQWMELDRQYIRDMSFWLDLRLIVLTPFAVLKSNGSY